MQEELRHTQQSLRVLWVVLIWLIAALIVVALGALNLMPRPMILMMIVGPVILGVLLWRRSPGLQAWGERVSLRVLALPHVLRIGFGSAFLFQVEQGTLPWLFGRPAGTGDVLAGLGALMLVLFGIKGRKAWIAWNVLGLCDMLMVVSLAQYHIFGGFMDQMQLMFVFPYALAPFITVPIVLMTHVLMLRRLLGQPRRKNAVAPHNSKSPSVSSGV